MALEKILAQQYGFAVYPSVSLYNERKKRNTKTGKMEPKWVSTKTLLFGDYIEVFTADGAFLEKTVKGKTYIKVRSRANGFILKTDIQANRILEVNFVDIGQGDGCHVVTPADQHLIIDAGMSDNMYRFLKWRYNIKFSKVAPPVFTAVISHPDSDHYGGFSHLFVKQKENAQAFKFDIIFHNGIVERSSKEKLGPTFTFDGITYLDELISDDASMRAHLGTVTKKSLYESVLSKAMSNMPQVKFEAAARPAVDQPRFLMNSPGMQIEVLAPLTEHVQDKRTLRYFKSKKGNTNDVGRTKNGHSIALKLMIGNISILLGGDLNPPAEDYLMNNYTKTDIQQLREQLKNAKAAAEIQEAKTKISEAIELAQPYFRVDFAKSCHHGSADFTSEFLRAINPIVTVISSGDDEPHCHPRPDTLGTIGKFSRGERSFIFSTELMRSSKEFFDIKDFRTAAGKQRAVTVYGMINLRTDGKNAIMAQKLERKKGTGWDIHKFGWDQDLKSVVHRP